MIGMNIGSLWGGAALLGFVTAAWSRIKMFLSRILSTLVVRVEVNEREEQSRSGRRGRSGFHHL